MKIPGSSGGPWEVLKGSRRLREVLNVAVQFWRGFAKISKAVKGLWRFWGAVVGVGRLWEVLEPPRSPAAEPAKCHESNWGTKIREKQNPLALAE